MKNKIEDKLKKLISENIWLGELPSSKLPKMKSNPLADKEPLKEEYIEVMYELEEGLEEIQESWEDWKNGPATEKHHIKPAKAELIKYCIKWLNKNIK